MSTPKGINPFLFSHWLPQIATVLMLVLVVAFASVESKIFAQEIDAYWVLDIDGSTFSADCVEEPSITTKGDWLYIVFVDTDGARGEAYTKGTVVLYQTAPEGEESE